MPGCVDALVGHLEAHPDVGAVAPFGYWDAGLHANLPPNVLPTLGDLIATTAAMLSPWCARRYAAARTRASLPVWSATAPVELPMLSGCCFLMRRSCIERVGFFDPRFPLYYEDTDLSVRLRRAGLRIVQTPAAKIAHLYGRSAQTAHGDAMHRYWQSRGLYYRKWYGRLGGALHDGCGWLLATAWGKRRAALLPNRDLIDLGTTNDRPLLRFGRRIERFLVEGSLDPHFFLACGIFGSGESWTPPDALFRNFGPTTYYWRVVDVSDARRPRFVAVFRHTLRYPTAVMLAHGITASS
jgi:hypothetical protein